MKYIALSAISALTVNTCNTKGIFGPISNWLQNWVINTTGQPLPSWGCFVTEVLVVIAVLSLIAGISSMPFWIIKIPRGRVIYAGILLSIPLGAVALFVYQLINP